MLKFYGNGNMRTAIVGSRTITDYDILEAAVKQSGFFISEVVSGGARGADMLGELYAKANNIPTKIFLPDWKTFGRSAGYRRNHDIITYAECVIALWDGQSRGTAHSIRLAENQKKPLFVMNVGSITTNRKPKETIRFTRTK